MNRRNLIRTGAVGLTCAAVGASVGILGQASGATPAAAGKRGHAGRGAAAGLLRRAVHADAVVATAGGAFADVSFDRGVLTSIAGNQLTLREGTKKATYKSVTVSVAPGAVVRLDRRPAQLSQLRVGDRVRVFHGPKRTRVAAFDTKAGGASAGGRTP